MKVCFAGGMANNSYMVAKQMARLGVEVSFLRDLYDFYPISQPVWEDIDFSMAYESLTPAEPWTLAKWHREEALLNWTAPEWMREVTERTRSLDLTESLRPTAGELCHRYGPGLYFAAADQMAACDVSFVSTNNAMISAMLSGKPYVVCPAGGEFMWASGLIKPQGNTATPDAIQEFEDIGHLVHQSFMASIAVVTYVPFEGHAELCGGRDRLESLFGHLKSRFWSVSMPYLARARLPSTERPGRFVKVMRDLGVSPPDRKYVAFIPSRIDYTWKGQDRLIDALSFARSAPDWLFVFSGWGEDYEKFKATTGRMDNVVTLPGTLSKPRLMRMFESVDLVVDQFLLGHYGTAAREALSVGTPVMAYVHDHLVNGPGGENLAPVINVQKPADIAAALDKLATDPGWAQRLSDAGLAWTRVHSDPRLMQRALERALEKPQ